MAGGHFPDERRMRAVLDSLPDPVLLLEAVRDDDGVIVDFTYLDANTAALAATRATRDELIGDRVLRRFPELGASGLIDAYAKVVETGEPAMLNDEPYRNELFRGHIQFLDIRAAKLGDGITLTWRDRSELHAALQALDEERARSRMTLDGLMDPVILFTPVRDDQARITDFLFAEVNQAACEYNRATREELVGSLMSERYPDMWPLGMFDRFVGVIERGGNLVADSWPYTSSFTGTEQLLDLHGHAVSGGLAVTWRDVSDRETAALALAESERRFRLLAEQASDVVFVVDPDHRVRWVSSAVTRLLGWSVEEFVGQDATSFIHPVDLASSQRRITDAHAGREHFSRGEDAGLLQRVRTSSGDYRWVRATAQPMDDPSSPPGVLAIGWHDVDSLVRANEAVSRSRLSMDEAAIGLLMSDVTGVVTYANDALARLTGLTADRIVGTRLIDSGPRHERPVLEALVGRVLSGESERESVRLSLRHVTGATVWVDSFVSPVRDTNGLVDGLLVQVVDVTAEVANREALIRNAEHFRLLAENASDVVYETNRTGQVVWVSPSILPALGWEPSSLVGTVALDLVHPEDREWVTREREDVYRGVDKTGLVARFCRSDGAIRYMSVSARVMRDGEGAVGGAVVGLHDVTTEVLMRNRIKRSEQMFRTAMVGAPQGMALSNAQDQITDLNPALEAILGARKVAVLGLTLADFVVPSDPPIPTCAERLVASGEDRITQHEHELVRVDAPRAWIEHSVSAIRDDDGTPMFFVHHVVDVTERRLREDDLDYRAQHDVLTGLLNRDGLLNQLSDRMPIHGNTTLAVLYCDLDNLKPINDDYGHAAGDAVLVEVARRIDTQLRRGDLVARIGGDEFVIVLDRIASDSDAMTVADKICQGAQGPVPFDGTGLPASVSMGIAVADPGDTVESLLGRADNALYRAKAGGRARVST